MGNGSLHLTTTVERMFSILILCRFVISLFLEYFLMTSAH
jgi:U3 small nucleolar RNA-associated protein 4